MKKQSRYNFPEFLKGKISQVAYNKWLSRKARAHVRRDRNRGFRNTIVTEYKQAIHEAVTRSKGKDEYTGWELDWHKIGTYRNNEARREGSSYMKNFAKLPTVDHSSSGVLKFKICSSIINDMKSYLTLSEFKKNCKAVLDYRN